MAASANKKPIMDVAKPGKTAATATSRPVIINHGAMVKDPMMHDDTETTTEYAPEKPQPVTKKIITPIIEEPQTEQTEEATAAPEEAPKQEDEKTTETQSPEESASDEAVVDAVVDQVTDKKAQEKLAEEEKTQRELVNKLVTDKKYFVPLAVARHSRNNKIGIIFIAMLIPFAVGLLLAVDAGLIGENISLPFDLVK